MNPSKRKARLIELIQKMDDGKDVSIRDMEIALTEDEYSEFTEMWANEKEKRSANKPDSIKRYETLLKKYYAAKARTQRYHNRTNKTYQTSRKLSNDVDICLEKIQECQQDNLMNSEFNIWLDRDIRASNDNVQINLGAPYNSFSTPALVVTSRSHDVQSRGMMEKLSKREIKKMMLEQALYSLNSPIDVDDNFDITNYELLLRPRRRF